MNGVEFLKSLFENLEHSDRPQYTLPSETSLIDDHLVVDVANQLVLHVLLDFLEMDEEIFNVFRTILLLFVEVVDSEFVGIEKLELPGFSLRDREDSEDILVLVQKIVFGRYCEVI